MREQSALIRQWILLKLLGTRNDWLAVDSLAPELDVDEKTIRRDMSTFKTFDSPIGEVASDDGRKSYRLRSHWAKGDLAVITSMAASGGERGRIGVVCSEPTGTPPGLIESPERISGG